MNNTMSIVCLILGASCMCSGVSRAEIEPVFVRVTSGNPYIVPSNRVFVVENVTLEASTNGGLYYLEFATSGGNNYNHYQDPNTSVSLARPLKVPGGGQIFYVFSGTWLLAGVLVDPSDLYAAVTSEFESLYASAGNAYGSLRLETARPTSVKIERTDDLQSPDWSAEMSALVERISGTERSFSVPTPGDDHGVYRAKARARE